MAIGTIWDGCECELQCFQYYISQTSLSITPNLDKYVIHSMRNLKKLQYESWATGALLRPLLQVLRVGGSEESEWVGATQNDSSLLPTLGRGIFVVPIYRCNWFFLVLQNGRTLWKFLAWVVAWSFRNIAARMETDCESLVTCSGKTKFRFFKIEKTGVKTWRWRSLGNVGKIWRMALRHTVSTMSLSSGRVFGRFWGHCLAFWIKLNHSTYILLRVMTTHWTNSSCIR